MNLVNQARNFGLILDGAMSTALEKQGVNTNNDLWTAVALENDLDKVYKVHMNYFKSTNDHYEYLPGKRASF